LQLGFRSLARHRPYRRRRTSQPSVKPRPSWVPWPRRAAGARGAAGVAIAGVGAAGDGGSDRRVL